ncbi:MAG: hypothetical protein HWN65_19955 [Candidatus Helarchaeota archaeon]|nr:hypothetical protein [Candidatus Helarchaeota archaeon]
MVEIIADSSFIINIAILNWLDLLCAIFNKVWITPTVKKETEKIKNLLKLDCITIIELSDEENDIVNQYLKELEKKFPGEHRGEIESLVVANFRGIPLLISDNFSPWYIKSKYSGIKVEIKRGIHFISMAIDEKIILIKNKEDLEHLIQKIRGFYPEKAIQSIKKKIQFNFKRGK